MAYLRHHLLTDAAARWPHRPAVSADDGLRTYRELDQFSTKVARALLGLGVAPGDRVAVLAPKSAASVTGIYGVRKAAACCVPLDPKAPAQRLGYVVRDSGARVILTDDAPNEQAADLAQGSDVLSLAEVAAESRRSRGGALPAAGRPRSRRAGGAG